MGRLRRHEGKHGTTFSTSCWAGGTMGLFALLLCAIGIIMLALSEPFIAIAARELFGPARGGVDGWLSWLFSQGISALTIPFALIGLVLVGVGLSVFAMGLIVTSVRREHDNLVCGFGLPGMRLAECRLPLASLDNLGLRVADTSQVGKVSHETLDLVVRLLPGVAQPEVIGHGLLGGLLARLARRNQRPMISTALLCKLTDGDEARSLLAELSAAWQVPIDTMPEGQCSVMEFHEDRRSPEH